jgi:hypothetical protein
MRASLTRLAGLGGVIGGFALAASYLAHPSSASPETVASAAWIWIHVGFMISLVAGVFLLTALFSIYQSHSGTFAGAVGYVLSTISLMFVFGLDYSEIFIFPVLAVEYPEVVERYGDGTSMPSVAFAFPLTGLAFLVGFVLFSYELLRKSSVDPYSAIVTIIGTIVFAAGLSGVLPMLVVRIGSVIFGLGLVMLGIGLMRGG